VRSRDADPLTRREAPRMRIASVIQFIGKTEAK